MKFSKSIIDRLVFADVDYLEKTKAHPTGYVTGHSKDKNTTQLELKDEGGKKPTGKTVGHESSTHTPTGKKNRLGYETYENKRYAHDPKKQTVTVEKLGEKPGKPIPANAAHEKELKNASYSLDFSKSVLANMGLLKDYAPLSPKKPLAGKDLEHARKFSRELQDSKTTMKFYEDLENTGKERAKKSLDIEKASKDYKINTKTIEQHEHPYGGHTVVSEGKGKNKKTDSVSLYDRDAGKMRISRGTKGSKGIPIDAEHEQELKNASYSLDFSKSILENMGLAKAVETRETDGAKNFKERRTEKWSRGPGKDYISHNDKEVTGSHPKDASIRQIKDKKTGVVGVESDHHTPASGGQRQSVLDKEGKITESYHRAAGGGPVVDKRRDISDIKPNSTMKNKSVFSVFDAILEKAGTSKYERKEKGSSRVTESDGDNLELPGGADSVMGNPGGSKEKASFERAEPGAIKNLKRLAESKDPNDRKAAEAGMKRH